MHHFPPTLKQVDWNMIRLDGAVDFAQSLSINDTLTYLDLSFNSLGTEGGVMLGVSILTNKRYEYVTNKLFLRVLCMHYFICDNNRSIF